jgi:hypothetical protein
VNQRIKLIQIVISRVSNKSLDIVYFNIRQFGLQQFLLAPDFSTTKAQICNQTSDFKCGSQCLPSEQVCDGTPQCDDKSDEEHCSAEDCSGADWFLCKNGKCISSQWVCDEINDCSQNNDGDLSDEMHCPETLGLAKKNSPLEVIVIQLYKTCWCAYL